MRNLVNLIGTCFISSTTTATTPFLSHLSRLPLLPTFTKSCVTSIPAGCLWMISSLFSSGTKFQTSLYKHLATQTSPNEEESKDDNFNRVLASIKIAPKYAEELCTSYVDRLCTAGKLPAAASFLQFLRDNNVHIGVWVYNCLLVAAAERSEVEILCQVFKDMVVSFESLSSASYLHFARGLLEASDDAWLLRLVKEVWELTSIRSTIVLNRIIFAFGESRQFDKALLIFNWMKDTECGPDLVTYNTVLEILGCAGRIDEMQHEFASMKEIGKTPDFISYNTILNKLQKVGRLDLCLVYYRDMVQSGIEPDLLTYTALIEGFGRAGNVEESLRIFNEMKKKQIRPSIYIYRSLIQSLKKMGKVELALTMLEEMNASVSNLSGPNDFKRKGRR